MALFVTRLRRRFLRFCVSSEGLPPTTSSFLTLASVENHELLISIWDVIMRGLDRPIMTPDVLISHFGASPSEASKFERNLLRIRGVAFLDEKAFPFAISRLLWPGQIRTLSAMIPGSPGYHVRRDRRPAPGCVEMNSQSAHRPDHRTYASSAPSIGWNQTFVPPGSATSTRGEDTTQSTRTNHYICDASWAEFTPLSSSAPAYTNRVHRRRRSRGCLPVALATPVPGGAEEGGRRLAARVSYTPPPRPQRTHRTTRYTEHSLPTSPPPSSSYLLKNNAWNAACSVFGWCSTDTD